MSDSPTTHDGARLWTLEEIDRLVSHSGNPAETLTNIVTLIQRQFETDVCSVYLLEPDRANLVLAATVGLRPESVGRVRMRLTQPVFADPYARNRLTGGMILIDEATHSTVGTLVITEAR